MNTSCFFRLKKIGVLALLISMPGCSFMGLSEQLKALTETGYISGRIGDGFSFANPLILIVYSKHDGTMKIIRSKMLTQSREFEFALAPGQYNLAFFEDPNGDFIYEAGETAVTLKEDLLLSPKQKISGIELNLTGGDSRPIDLPPHTLFKTSAAEIPFIPLKIDKPVSLDDPRFDEENGTLSLWKFKEFQNQIGGGVFFLENYDPKKIPVLFIHGYADTPREFQYLIEHMDRRQFQPWVVFYPSAMRLEIIADNLNSVISDLHMTYKFPEMHVVAFSMGGLIARSFILKNSSEQHKKYIRAFVSIATPWKGHSLAQLRKIAPVQVPAWEDFARGSDFNRLIFSSALPKSTRYYLFFGYRGHKESIGGDNDEHVSLQSALDARAQRESVKIYAFNESHTGLLKSPEVSAALNTILHAESKPGRNQSILGLIKQKK